MYSPIVLPLPSPTTWATTIAIAFLVGVLATIITAMFIFRPDSRATHSFKSWMRRRRNEPTIMHNSDKPPNMVSDIEEPKEGCGVGEQASSQPTFGKRFEFRPRLWNEPPDLDYSEFEHYDAVQKEFKAIGGRDLAWRTALLDMWTEEGLTAAYCKWIEQSVDDDRPSEADTKFYEGLYENLTMDLEDILSEEKKRNARLGKTRRDVWEMVELTNTVIDREKAKVGRKGVRAGAYFNLKH